MRLFVLEGCHDCEPGEILGAYASPELAIEAAESYLAEGVAEFDGYSIQEQLLDAEAASHFSGERSDLDYNAYLYVHESSLGESPRVRWLDDQPSEIYS